uniref:Interleukin-22 n=1 Tax=Latimeria chalumnae TaxID=7897 RepID=H3A664_LATCH
LCLLQKSLNCWPTLTFLFCFILWASLPAHGGPISGPIASQAKKASCKIAKSPPHIGKITYTLAKWAQRSDADTVTRLIDPKSLFSNKLEEDHCYQMKEVLNYLLQQVLMNSSEAQAPAVEYPHLRDVLEFFAKLSEDLTDCKLKGDKKGIESNMEVLKDKIKKLGESARNKAIGELDQLLDTTLKVCS